jgi:hypothetical protein
LRQRAKRFFASFVSANPPTTSQLNIAAMLTYVSRFWSGGFEPFWPHVLLLSLSVLASFGVGAGIIFENPKYSAAVHRVAFWLVVAGVVVEAICTIFCSFSTKESVMPSNRE